MRWDDKTALLLRFEKGDVLEYHEHTPDNYHDVFVIEGKVRIAGEHFEWTEDVGEGDFYVIPDDRQSHQIIPLTDCAIAANIYREQRPNLERMIGQDWA